MLPSGMKLWFPCLTAFLWTGIPLNVLADREDRLERRREANEEYPELALRLENPLARILALPIDIGFQKGGGAGPDRFAVRFAPRVPFVLNDDWHLISRTEFSWVETDGKDGVKDSHGLTDVTQSFFFSPDEPAVEELYWGAGFSMVLPVATDRALGSNQFSLGPTLGVFRQRDPWTLGMTLTQLWSVAGEDDARNVSLTRVEPVVAYTSSMGTTVALSAEMNYDWLRGDWEVPIEFSLSQLTLLRDRALVIGLGARYWVVRDGDQPSWGAFLKLTLPLRSPRWGERKAME